MDTRTTTERELGIEVVKREKVVVYRETISLKKKDRISDAVAYIHSQLHHGKVTGKAAVNLNQGGVTQVVTEQTGRVRIGSELDELTDDVFCLNKPAEEEIDTPAQPHVASYLTQ